MGCAVGRLRGLRHDCIVVLHIVGVVLVATILLKQTFGQRLRFVLDVLLQLVWLLAQSGSIDVTRPTNALLRLKVLMHQVGEEPAPVKLELIRF